MKGTILEHELRTSYIDSILTVFFSVENKFKYRNAEINLPERKTRTDYQKCPDTIVSSIQHNHSSYSRLVGETKNSEYDADYLGTIVNDKYRRALFAKDVLDSAGLKKVILFQANVLINKLTKLKGFKNCFYTCELVNDDFYAVTYLFDVKIPASTSDIISCIYESNKLYHIQNLLMNDCILEDVNEKKSWRRYSLESPVHIR